MRILIAQKWPYYPNTGGGSKSQRLMVAQLTRLGHECHLVTPAWASVGDRDTARATQDGVVLHTVAGLDAVPAKLTELAGTLRPDWVLLPNDDHEWRILAAALDAAPGRVACLVHTIQQLPFGPHAFRTDQHATELLSRCAALLCVSRAARDYLAEEAGLRADVVYPNVYEDLHTALAVGESEQDAVLMVNPCPYKGIDLLLALAAALPDVPFVGVRGWATSDRDLARMAKHPNVSVTDHHDDVRVPLSRARALLMPSLWTETFGYVCVEAMLTGVPVLAADVGGLREAKLGVPHLLPVSPITTYRDSGESWRPDCDVPAQDVGPWRDAVLDVLDDGRRAELSDRSRAAAEGFVAGLRVTDLQDRLLEGAR